MPYSRKGYVFQPTYKKCNDSWRDWADEYMPVRAKVTYSMFEYDSSIGHHDDHVFFFEVEDYIDLTDDYRELILQVHDMSSCIIEQNPGLYEFDLPATIARHFSRGGNHNIHIHDKTAMVIFKHLKGPSLHEKLDERDRCNYCTDPTRKYFDRKHDVLSKVDLKKYTKYGCSCQRRRWKMIRDHVKRMAICTYIEKLAFLPTKRNLKRLYDEM